MEFLKEFLGDELYAQVEAKLKGNDKVKLGNLAEGAYVAKEKFAAVESENKGLQEQMKSAASELEKIKKTSGDNESLTKQITEWQDKHKADTQALAAENAKIKLNGAIDVVLMGAKVRDVTAAKALLDMEKVKLDGEKLLGIDDQVAGLKKDKGWLFDTESAPGIPGANPAAPPAKPDPKTPMESITSKTGQLFGQKG